MGLLKAGNPLSFEEGKPYAEYVKKHGIIQFLNIYNQVKDRKDEVFYWGDEVEYMLVCRDDEKKRVYLDLRGNDVLNQLMKDEEEQIKKGQKPIAHWNPEYAKYMIEGTPGEPYGSNLPCLVEVESNMIKRREYVKKFLKDDQLLLTLTMFPLIGAVKKFTYPPAKPGGKFAKSLFLPDEIINPHPRFGYINMKY